MFAQVPIFPEQASTFAPEVDGIYTYLVGVSTLITLLITGALFYFAFKYRRRSEHDRPRPTAGSLRLEIAWTVFPLIVFLSFFYLGARVYMNMYRPPDDAMEVYVVGRQWMWYTQHLGGQRQNQGLTVPLGRPVKLTMISQDVIHDFAIPAFRIRQDVLPGRYSTMWFKATKAGKFHLFCAEYCGTNHSRMVGWVTVLPPSEFQEWLASPQVDGSAANEGRKLFLKLQCLTCHSNDAQARGPNLENLYKTEVPLQDGGRVTATEEYIRESILKPKAKVVAGFQPIMPSYQGQVTEIELLQVFDFLKTLKTGQTPPRTEHNEPPGVNDFDNQDKQKADKLDKQKSDKQR